MADGGVIELVKAIFTGLVGVLGVFIGRRSMRAKVEPQPLAVQAAPEFVTRKDFERHVADNAREHENIFSRMNRNDRETSEIKGMLAGMRDDLSAIKNKLFKTRGA